MFQLGTHVNRRCELLEQFFARTFLRVSGWRELMAICGLLWDKGARLTEGLSMMRHNPTMRKITINVVCTWDRDSGMWTAESDNLPGLVTEAPSIPELIQRVMEVAPELIEDNLMGGSISEAFLLDLVPVYQQAIPATA